jgi:hypothetical protein
MPDQTLGEKLNEIKFLLNDLYTHPVIQSNKMFKDIIKDIASIIKDIEQAYADQLQNNK